MKHDTFAVTGMTCSACSAHVEKSVCHLAGVSSVSVHLLSGSMAVDASIPSVANKPTPTGIKMATVVIAITPIMSVYPFLQKYFVKGLTLGAVKG